MSRYFKRPGFEYAPVFPDPPATTSKPEKPNGTLKKIAEKMKSDAERIVNGGKKYGTYNVDWYINNGDIYCFRVCVDNGVIDVCGEYSGGIVDNIEAKKVNDQATESMELDW